MGRCSAGLHVENLRIQRAETHGARKMADCGFGFAQPNPYPSAREPSRGEVRIERKNTIDQAGTGVNIAHNTCNHVATHAECDRIILAQLHSPSRLRG